MIGPLTAARRLTSTATGLAVSTVRTGVSVASTALQGAVHLVHSGSSAPEAKTARSAPEQAPEPTSKAPEPVRVPTPPDPAVKLAEATAAAAGTAAKKAPAKKAGAKPGAKKAGAKPDARKAGGQEAGNDAAASTSTAKKTTGPKPAPPKKKASEVPLKSDPTPASAAPPVPEGPDVLPGEGGATGMAEPQPLLDASVAKQIRNESEVLRRASE